MPLPKALRRLTPDRIRDDPRLRAPAIAAGLIPPRTMHSEAEAAALERLAAGRRTVVEIGVYEGASAVRLCRVLGAGPTLHLIDPFGEQPSALRPGARATERATRRVVERAARSSGTRLVWHVGYSHDVAQDWTEPVDLVFVDGDHSEEGVRVDWQDWHPLVAPGGVLVFHDARAGQPGGRGLPGPTAVVEEVLRPEAPPGWEVAEEVDSLVAVRRLSPASR